MKPLVGPGPILLLLAVSLVGLGIAIHSQTQGLVSSVRVAPTAFAPIPEEAAPQPQAPKALTITNSSAKGPPNPLCDAPNAHEAWMQLKSTLQNFRLRGRTFLFENVSNAHEWIFLQEKFSGVAEEVQVSGGRRESATGHDIYPGPLVKIARMEPLEALRRRFEVKRFLRGRIASDDPRMTEEIFGYGETDTVTLRNGDATTLTLSSIHLPDNSGFRRLRCPENEACRCEQE